MRTLWQIIAGIFRWTWRLLNFIRELILNLFPVLLIPVGVGIYLSFQSSSTSTAPARALLVDLSGVVVDQPSVNNRVRQWGRELLGASSSRLQENSLFDVVDSIRKAKDDKNITGMVLQLNDFAGADQPSLRYIGKALREFRDSGKPIFAIGDSYNQTQYFPPATPTKSTCRLRARSICTVSPPTIFTTNRCWTCLRSLPISSASAPINRRSSR